MAHILIRHKVKDYAKWKPVFDQHAATRREKGSRGGILLRSAEDPNELVILFEWEDHKKARDFAESADLRKAMEKAGVSDKPDVYFLDEIEWPPV
jgi:quinol monooxygenase YgiN